MNHQKLTDIKLKLARNRLTTPLFDTPLFTKNLEAAYIKMYERYQADLSPDHISITQVEFSVPQELITPDLLGLVEHIPKGFGLGLKFLTNILQWFSRSIKYRNIALFVLRSDLDSRVSSPCLKYAARILSFCIEHGLAIFRAYFQMLPCSAPQQDRFRPSIFFFAFKP